MITTRTISQQILGRIKKFTSDSDITENDVILAVSQMFAALVIQRSEIFKQTDKSYTPDGSYYFLFENVPVTGSDPKRFKLPANPTATPHGLGIRVYKKIGGEQYIQVPSTFTTTTNSLINRLGGNLGYYIKGDRGFFVESDSGLEPPDEIVVELLTPIMDANPDAYMMIPGDLQQEIVEKVYQLFVHSDQIQADETKDDVDAKV